MVYFVNYVRSTILICDYVSTRRVGITRINANIKFFANCVDCTRISENRHYECVLIKLMSQNPYPIFKLPYVCIKGSFNAK